MNWKKSFRKLPDKLTAKLGSIPTQDIVIACTKKITTESIGNGDYSHLGIKMESGKPVFPTHVIPKPNVGRSSRINAEGLEIVRRDLPMVSKDRSFESPNWRGYGTHTVSWSQDVYQRDFVPPRGLGITIELLGQDVRSPEVFIFKFSVDGVFNKKQSDFQQEFFFAVNLLQENVGRSDVFPSDAKRSDYLKTVYVDWEILPPGEREETITKILSGFKAPTEEDRQKVADRYDFLIKLKPTNFITGVSGFDRYIGAMFGDQLAAFENLEYGNAIYVMPDDWQRLSKLTRLELLANERGKFIRIVHTDGWKGRFKEAIASNRKG